MDAIPVIAVFDVGKTNKKLFLFDEHYHIVFEKTARFTETVDEDGFPCENLESLRLSIFDSLAEIFRQKRFILKAVNFCTYGASIIYLDNDGKPLAPLYNYLKPYPPNMAQQLYNENGGSENFSLTTASPLLGSLNSGLQIYRLKQEHPGIFTRIKYALHLPQYMSYLLTGKMLTDLTSIGCHTALWDFAENRYHNWVKKEGLLPILAPIENAGSAFSSIFQDTNYKVGIGLHDSSAALIPYMVSFTEPFILLSTGTWCISMNPFNTAKLTREELKKDCLCFMQYQGVPVKASRVFSGYEYEQQLKRIAAHFNCDSIKYRNIEFNPSVGIQLDVESLALINEGDDLDFRFRYGDLSDHEDDVQAYYHLMIDLVRVQKASTSLILNGTMVKRIFVDGGFSKNSVYMNLLAIAFPDIEIFAASMAQATALGAALILHQEWNTKKIPNNLIGLQHYSSGRKASLKKK